MRVLWYKHYLIGKFSHKYVPQPKKKSCIRWQYKMSNQVRKNFSLVVCRVCTSNSSYCDKELPPPSPPSFPHWKNSSSFLRLTHFNRLVAGGWWLAAAAAAAAVMSVSSLIIAACYYSLTHKHFRRNYLCLSVSLSLSHLENI